jgi:hypothetical protein
MEGTGRTLCLAFNIVRICSLTNYVSVGGIGWGGGNSNDYLWLGSSQCLARPIPSQTNAIWDDIKPLAGALFSVHLQAIRRR